MNAVNTYELDDFEDFVNSMTSKERQKWAGTTQDEAEAMYEEYKRRETFDQERKDDRIFREMTGRYF